MKSIGLTLFLLALGGVCLWGSVNIAQDFVSRMPSADMAVSP